MVPYAILLKNNHRVFTRLCLIHLEHTQGTSLVALTDHNLADQVGILPHQHVLEVVDLNQRKILVFNFMCIT